MTIPSFFATINKLLSCHNTMLAQQMKVLQTINVLLGELHEKISLLITFCLPPIQSPLSTAPHATTKILPQSWPFLDPSHILRMNPVVILPKMQLLSWPSYTLALTSSLALASEIVPYKKRIPAKSPVIGGQGKLRATQTKYHMYPSYLS